MNLPAAMPVESFFDPTTSTFSHLTWDPGTSKCAIVDSVLDYDPRSGRTSTGSADRLIDRVRERGLAVQWLLETHAHADHLTAAPYLQKMLGGRIAVGRHIVDVQRIFGQLFNAGPSFRADGSDFDHLFDDEEVFEIGDVPVRVMHTPGHTPACVTYLVLDGDHPFAFVGDTIFLPEYGTARCDFPGGDAGALYRSVRKVLSLPSNTRLMLCHDYPVAGAEPRCVTTVAAQRAGNVHVRDGVVESDFVAMREARDATLAMPALLLPAIQVNMRAGHLPPAEDNGVRYLKIPLDVL